MGTSLPTPTATRLRRPGWRDPRLLVGVLLVLLATALGARAVASARDTVPVWAAATTIKVGDHVTAGSVRRVEVQLGDLTGRYLPADRSLPDDTYAVRSVPSGQLVPLESVGPRADVDVQQVAVSVDAVSATGLTAGSVVDLWVSRRDPSTTQERYRQAERLLTGVTVAGVPQDSSTFGASSARSAVLLLVPRGSVGEVIGGTDALARFTLVPAPGTPGS